MPMPRNTVVPMQLPAFMQRARDALTSGDAVTEAATTEVVDIFDGRDLTFAELARAIEQAQRRRASIVSSIDRETKALAEEDAKIALLRDKLQAKVSPLMTDG